MQNEAKIGKARLAKFSVWWLQVRVRQPYTPSKLFRLMKYSEPVKIGFFNDDLTGIILCCAYKIGRFSLLLTKVGVAQQLRSKAIREIISPFFSINFFFTFDKFISSCRTGTLQR